MAMKNHKFIFNILLGMLAVAAAEDSNKYIDANGVTTCSLEDQSTFSECFRKTLNTLVARYKDGDENLNIPKLDPLKLNSTSIVYNSELLAGRVSFSEALCYGVSTIDFQEIKLDVKGDKIKVYMKTYMEKMKMVGKYKGALSIYSRLNVKPKGTFLFDMDGVTLKGNAEGNIYEKDNHRFVRLERANITPTLKSLKMNATGIVPDPELNDQLIQLGNENWEQALNLLLTASKPYLIRIMLQVANIALATTPFDDFVKT